MNTRNSCYTYFKINGNFHPDVVTELLQLTPEKTWKIGDLRPNGTKFDFAHWEIGRCTEYDVHVENQMRKTIAVLQDKISLLNQIRQEYDVRFFLVIVPYIYVDDINPCLAPSLDVMDFCCATNTEIDLDMYLHNEEKQLIFRYLREKAESLTIGADDDQNVKFLFASVMLGMIELIEKGKISSTDAAMAFFLPMMLRTKENTLIYQICSMAEELDTYPPTRRAGEINKIRTLCYEMMADYSRTGQAISFEFQYGDEDL